MTVGTVVRVKGERGRFTVVGFGKDGSLTLYGGSSGRERFRSVELDRVMMSVEK